MKSNTKERFRSSLQRIAADLSAFFRLEFKQEVQHLSDPLFRWLDFRLRYIDPMPRQILVSNKFPKRLPSSVEVGLHMLERLFREGGDTNPYQSKSLVRFNDHSGKKRAKRTDFLWADWGISHLHLSDIPIPNDEHFAPRACSDGEAWLLFCIVVGDTVGFIDIRKHEDDSVFSDPDLIKTVRDSWPSYMDKFRLNGIMPGKVPPTSDEIAKLRKNGVAAFSVIDGEVFIGPGMGVTSASTPLRVTDTAHRVLDWIDTLADLAEDPDGPFLLQAKRLGATTPLFELCLTPRGLALFEPSLDAAFILLSQADDEFSTYYKKMENLIFPEWARQAVASKFFCN